MTKIRVYAEGIHLLGIFWIHEFGDIQVTHLAGDARGQPRGIETGDRADAGAAGGQGGPVVGLALAEVAAGVNEPIDWLTL